MSVATKQRRSRKAASEPDAINPTLEQMAGDPPRVRGESKAVAFRTLAVSFREPTPCSATVYVAQDEMGLWYASSSLEWSASVPWPRLDSAMCPSEAEKFGDWKAAVCGQAFRLKRYLTKCRETAEKPESLELAANAWLDVDDWSQAVQTMTKLPDGVSRKTQPEDGAQNRGTDVPRSPARSAEQEIPVEKIHRRPSNRGGVPVEVPEVADLAASIDRFGLSTPVEVRAASEEQELPLGHYELLKGERRWKAHQVLGRETIRAVVVECDAAAAAAAVAVDNTHRRDLDPIARARGIKAAQEQGLSLEDAGLAHGLGASAAKNALRLLQLPASVQAAVSAGKLDQAVAIAAVPLMPVPGAAQQLERAVKKGAWWLQRPGDARHMLERELINGRAVPIAPKAPEPWRHEKVLVADPKKLTAADREALGIVEVRLDNKPRLLATNLQEVERRQAAAEEGAEQREQARRKKAVAEGRPANPDAERQQDEALQRKTEELYYLWLRLLIAEALQPGDPRTLRIVWWLSGARGEYGNPLVLGNFVDGVLAIRGRQAERKKYRGYDSAWAQSGMMLGTDDWVTDHELSETLLAQLILWPVFRGDQEYSESAQYSEELAKPETLPESWPKLQRDEIAAAAEWLSKTPGPVATRELWDTSIADGWRAAAERPRGPHRRLMETWLSYHNGRQLERLAGELKLDLDPAAKVADRRAEIVSRHSERRLPLPKSLAKLRGK